MLFSISKRAILTNLQPHGRFSLSTLVSSNKDSLLKSEEDLQSYFIQYAKPRDKWLVGIEAEFLGVERVTGRALSYEGPHGIENVLRFLGRQFQYEPILDQGCIIALKRGSLVIGLEPGGQIELSAPPVSNIFEIGAQVENFAKELRAAEKKFPEIKWLAYGIQPFSKLEEISWVPKTRYQIMAEHLSSRGALSHHMMKRTATNQLNVDYSSEADAMKKLRVVLGTTSMATALFANSSFSEGKPNGYATYRLEIWNHTDPERSGLLTEFLQPGKTFQDYLKYILDMPMIFIVRAEQWIPLKGKTFRHYLREGFEGTRATLNDFELHLSTAFPEARVKQFLEIRGADCQSVPLIPAVAAFWKGILYDDQACGQAWDIVADLNIQELLDLHHRVPREGLKAQAGRRSVLQRVRDLVDISCAGLGRQQKGSGHADECFYIQKLREMITVPGRSPGETLIEKWHQELGQNPQKLIAYLSL